MIQMIEINAKFVHNNLALRYFREIASNYHLPVLHQSFTINQSANLILSAIREMDSQVYLFSCYIWNIDLVLKLSKAIKMLDSAAKIILGGPEVSFHDEDWLKKHDYIDVILKNEGETWFTKIGQLYESDPKMLLAYLSLLKGIVAEPALMDISGLGVPYTDSELETFKIAYYESSRGCPYTCSYCMSARGSKLRYKSIEQVKLDLARFFRANTPVIKFVDRTFNAPVDRAIAIMDYIKEIDNGVTTCHFELSPTLLNDKLISKIATLRKNLVQFEIGIQSTNERTIKAIQRNMPISSLAMVEKLCALDNCHTHLDLIAGLPYEGVEEFEKSFNDVLALGPDHLQLGMLKILHGSLIKEQLKEHGYVYDEHPPYEFYQNRYLSFLQKQDLVACEEGVESYHNAELFTNTLAHLYKSIDSPYRFYQQIGAVLIHNQLHSFPDGFDNRLILLRDMIVEHTSSTVEMVEGLLAFDLLNVNQKLPKSLSHMRVETHGKWHDVIRNHPEMIPTSLKEQSAKQLIKLMTVFKSNYHIFEKRMTDDELYYVKFKNDEAIRLLDTANVKELKEFY
ncbi:MULTISPECIES: B12-binding domain-containing radical SAM protein [unclassified Fusibacter]|uniref:B12-binding domain-containing radical SAM protein n=1 Tax=unclassified Fusibacter TaxID=2624464 RepID=UPI0010132B2A|nr:MULTISPECIES: DUF4080 domain-containing protein [unclassified Fusibacter]MCK8059075.1 DUF4080 domain-containing protein [Fusibacter sp. A2]NPE22484.1 DUF4080 domain-containing protein [Fusibacter sp. A1]RXV60588.1 DUF4080 domain-containing protein [Fusibacter sp. A1]